MSAPRATEARRAVLAALLAAVLPTAVAAQRSHWLAFRGAMGEEAPHGDASRIFDGNIRGEFSVLATPDRIGSCPLYPAYLGFGFAWVSFPVEPGYGDGSQEYDEWNYVGPHLIGGLTFEKWMKLPLYLELRLERRRLRPQRQQDFEIHSDHYRKERPYPEFSAFAMEGVVGLDIGLKKPKIYLDVSGRVGQFGVKGQIASSQLIDTLKSSWVAGLQVGVLWFP